MTDEGDEVCWLHRLCPDCGAMPTAGTDTCWRCGADVPDERPEPSCTSGVD